MSWSESLLAHPEIVDDGICMSNRVTELRRCPASRILGRRLQSIHAYGARSDRPLNARTQDRRGFLTVVMESDDAGLKTVGRRSARS